MSVFPEDDRPAGVPRGVLDSWRVAAIVSLVAHVALGGISAFVVARSFSSEETKPAEIGRTYPAPDPDAPIVVELASVEGTADLSMTKTAEGESKVAAPPPMLAGGEKIARIDDGKGKGGDGKSLDPARNLAAHAEEHTTVDETRDAIKDEQENRLKTGKTRKSNVDLRVALEPMELTFVASGKGFRYERHPVAKSDASLGFASGKGTAIGGAAIGGQPLEGVSDTQKNAGTASLGGKEASPASGAAYGNVMVGTPQLVGANVAKARPHVDKGKPSVTSNAQGLPSDTIDGDQATADAMKSLVSMSTKGGAVGDGKGGVGGGGAAGAGGASGDGSHAVALGDGDGPLDAPHAYQRTGWYLAFKKRLGPLVHGTFPKALEMDLHNGTVIVDLVIAKGGKLIDVVVVRPSGFEEFDQNVVTRFKGADTFDPVPDKVSMGPSITIRVPVFGGFKAP